MIRYKCIKSPTSEYESDLSFILDGEYLFDRYSEIYIPIVGYEEPVIIEVAVFSDNKWIPLSDFNKFFKKMDDIREEKIDFLLK